MVEFQLFIGRFQPFHKGHLHAIKQLENPVIIIGSIKKSHTPQNPMTAEERKKMIEKTLLNNNLKIKIYEVEDDISDDIWYKNIKKIKSQGKAS